MSKEEDEKKYFKLHVHRTNDSGTEQKTEQKKEPKPKKNVKNNNLVPNGKKRTLGSILRNAARQIIASAIILVIGFLLLNWSAYYQIAKDKYREIRGIEIERPMEELVEEKEIVYEEKKLEVSKDPEIQKKQIPPLNLEIAPSDNRIIIPRIDQNIPIVRISSENLIRRDWDALENEMQEALRGGVVHYPGTSLPGQSGNVAITGHSSYFPWDPGRFKDVFALLHNVVEGDRIVIYYEQDKYIYEVSDIKIVLPEDIDVLKQTPDDRLTLITCTPVGTNLKRLIVAAKPIQVNSKQISDNNKISR
ncbi:sortase [Candidatus Peregrinibacteria bacterium]|nr:sortase [Candidatus Peregrinibacteria bacterium]